MRKHMTHGQMVKINKLLRNGVTDMAEIQALVPVHQECIKSVAKKYLAEQKPVKKASGKKKDAPVDPIS
jgi:hypothetical protein